MDLCVTLIDNFKKSTINDLTTKGMSIVDQNGDVMKNMDTVMDKLTQESRKERRRPEDKFMCKARVWNEGYGARCSKIKKPEGEYCAQHQSILNNYGRLIYGKWNGRREVVYPYRFRDLSEKAIQWKGRDPRILSKESSKSLSSSKSEKSEPVVEPVAVPVVDKKSKTKSKSSRVRKAAVKIQARQRGRNVRKTQRKKKESVKSSSSISSTRTVESL